MPAVDNPIGLSIEENHAFITKAWSCVVGVVNLIERVNRAAHARTEEIGTGGAYLWRNKRVILTAKHILDDATSSDIAFLPRTDTSHGHSRPARPSDVSARVIVKIEQIVRCPWEDLAAIVLDDDGAKLLNVDFYELPDRFADDKNLTQPGSLLVIGFPIDKAFEVSKRRILGRTEVSLCSSCDSFWGEIVCDPTTTIDSGYSPERHLLIRFEPASEGVRPYGYSGATVWCDRVKQGAIWEACPVLVGIQTHAYIKSGLVRAIKAGIVRKFLEESL